MKLAELMKDRGLSDGDLAKKLKCANSTVFQWRTGIYLPRAEYLIPLCEILQCSADDLLGIDVEKATRLNRAQSVDLWQAVTRRGDWDSQTIHQMASALRRKRGKLTEFEKWLRDMAEAVYRIELTLKTKSSVTMMSSVQLSIFDK